jgi:hypothetical protein
MTRNDLRRKNARHPHRVEQILVKGSASPSSGLKTRVVLHALDSARGQLHLVELQAFHLALSRQWIRLPELQESARFPNKPEVIRGMS